MYYEQCGGENHDLLRRFLVLNNSSFQVRWSATLFQRKDTSEPRQSHVPIAVTPDSRQSRYEVIAMSETSALKFKQAYDEAKSTIASSLDAVKVAYENINRDLADEIKTLDKEKKDLTASLNKAKKDIEGLNNTVNNLESSLAASKEQVISTQRSLEVRSGAHLPHICSHATILSIRSPPDPIGAPPLPYSRADAGSRFFYFAG